MRIRFGILLLLSFVVAGCLNPEQEAGFRFDCVGLSSGSFALVPDCGSQEECYQKVQGELFSFDDSQLDFESRRALESYKNALALSWRYFNEGQIELKKIRDLCGNRGQWNELPLRVNRLNHSLVQAFAAADEANKQAIVFLASEKEWLAEQQLDLVREEPLFDDWILLQNNLNELQTKKTRGNSLASKMLQTQERIDAVFARYGFGKRFVSSEQLADLLPENRTGILRSLPKEPFLPVFGGLVIDFAARLSNQQRLQESVQTLKRFPAFAFFSAYRELVGSEDSVAFETASLAKRLAGHHAQTGQKTGELKQALEERIRSDGERVQKLQIGIGNGLSPETFQSLVVALKPQTRISLKNFEITDLAETQPKLEKKLFEIQTDFSKTIENWALGRDSLGMRLKSLKQTKNRLAEWESNLLFLETAFQSGLLELCAERIRQIGRETQQEFSEATALELAAQTRFFAEQFGEEKENGRKLDYCAGAIQASENLLLFVIDQKKFESETLQAGGTCFSFLETAFQSGAAELKELKQPWQQLQQKRANSNSAIPELAAECNWLGKKTREKLLDSEKIRELQQDFSEIGQYWGGIRQLQLGKGAFPAEKRVLELRAFFVGNQLLLEKALPVLEELSQKSRALREELREQFGRQLKEFLQQTVQADSFSETIPKTGQTNWLFTRFVFSNPASIEWPETFSVEIPGEWQSVSAQEASPNIATVFLADQKLLVLFSGVPPGISTATIKSEQFVSTREKNEFLFANQFKALTQKTIGFETETEFSELMVSTDLLGAEAANVWVVFKNRELPFSRSGSRIEFRAEKVSKTSTVSVFSTIPNPLQITESFSGTGNELQWRIEIENRLAERIPKPQIVVPLPRRAIAELDAHDESGHRLSAIQLENEARIELPELLPHENQTIVVTARTNSQEELLETVALETQTKLEALANHANPLIQETAQRLLAELLGLRPGMGAETVFRIARQTRELLEKANRYRLDEQQFLETNAQTEKKIGELLQLVQNLRQQGFSETGLELEQRIYKAQELLRQARNSRETGDLQLAATTSLRALAALEEGKNGGLKAFEQKKKEIRENAQELLTLIAELLPKNAEALEQQRRLQGMLVSLEQSAWETNPLVFLGRLNDANAALEKTGQTLSELVKTKAMKAHGQLGEFQKLFSKEGFGTKNKTMLEWLDEHPENGLVRLGIALPFRKSDLEKRQQKIAGLVSEKQEAVLAGFEALFQQQEFAKSLRLHAKNQSELEEILKQGQALQQAVEADWYAIKEMAGIALQKSRALADQEKLDSKQAALLLKAQKAFDQERFLEALVLAKKIGGNQSGSSTGLWGLLNKIPMAIVPVLFGIAALAFIRLRKKETKEKEAQKIRIERVPNEW